MKLVTSLVFLITINFAFGYSRALQKNRNSKFMLSHPVAANFFRAQEYCQMYNMKLVSILNVSQFHDVQAFLHNLPAPIPGVLKMWTSANDLGQPNDFVWLSNGKSVKNIESMWAPEQILQDNTINDGDCQLNNCGALSNTFDSTIFNLYRSDCYERNIFLCEY